jgi:Tfp pilus assembly protein PilE
VIVVVAILATITIVAYNGIQARAYASTAQNAVEETSKKVLFYAADNDIFPVQLSDVSIASSPGITYQYTYDNVSATKTFCITATVNSVSYYQSNNQETPSSGICAGHSFLIWNKFVTATAPIPAATIDASPYRTTTPSERLSPLQTNIPLRDMPIAVTTGSVYRLDIWLKSDPGWNGTSTNSKIRFGNGVGGALLLACGYGGVKLTWTLATCSYTVAAGVTSMSVSVGNDGTTGNLWVDDLALVKL